MPRTHRPRHLTILPLLATLLALSAIASTAAAQPSTPSTDANDDERTMTVSVYFLRDEKIAAAHREIVIPEDKTVAASTIRELLAGPTADEEDAGLSTAIPDQTELLGIEIAANVATVDLSKNFESGGGSLALTARLAQVAYTLTQFPTIEAVTFALEGQPVETFGGEGITLDEPVDRTDYDDLTPLIFVESPAPGDVIESPVQIWGTANTFEATFIAEIVDADGAMLARDVVTATSGSGTRGTFDVEIPYDPGDSTEGTVVVYELSARDGSQVNLVEIPVELGS